jgi:predicted nucleic acid-binding protein
VRVYLDSCAIQRPLDTYTHTRIVLEAEAVLGILALCEAGQLELVSSEALEYETEQNPWPVRKEHARAALAKARMVAIVDDAVEEHAKAFTELGVKPLDALHLALAEAAGVDYFCTCDDRLLHKIKQIQGLKVKVASPIELIQEFEA